MCDHKPNLYLLIVFLISQRGEEMHVLINSFFIKVLVAQLSIILNC